MTDFLAAIFILGIAIGVSAFSSRRWPAVVAAAALFAGMMLYVPAPVFGVRAHIEMARERGEAEDFVRGYLYGTDVARLPVAVTGTYGAGLLVLAIIGVMRRPDRRPGNPDPR